MNLKAGTIISALFHSNCPLLLNLDALCQLSAFLWVIMHFSAPPAYSFAGKPVGQVETTPLITPGPGTYSVRQEVDYQTTAIKFGQSLRRPDLKAALAPGPGAYETASFLELHQKSPQHGGGKKGKPAAMKGFKDRVNRMLPDYPGPGTYNPANKSSAPSLPIASKTFAMWKGTEATPGPGAYSPTYSDRRPEVSMKFGQRSSLNGLMGTFGPGPAAYNTRRADNSPKYGFGTGPKMVRSSSTEGVPGPGKYSTFTASGRGVVFSGKPVIKPLDSNPGPGSYSPKDPVTSPSIGIEGGKRAPFLIAKDLPGPGEYNPSNPVHRIVHSTNLNMSARRPLGPIDPTPGPGTYAVPSTVEDGPKVSIGGRRGELSMPRPVPGPGAHSPSFDIIHSHRPMAGISSSQRSVLSHTSGSPGAKYEVAKRFDGPAWTFKKDSGVKLDDSLDDVGPGLYKIPPTVPDAPKYLIKNRVPI